MTASEAEPPEPAPKKLKVSVHRCERCRQYFRSEADIDRGYIPKRWLCPPCYEYLLDEGRVDERSALKGAPWSSRN